MTVTFASKCWEGDYRMMPVSFKNKVQSIGYPFDTTMIVVNNVNDKDSAESVLEGVSDAMLFVSDALHGIVSSLNLVESPNIYASGEITAVMACETEYLTFIQGDCLTTGGDWITPAINVLENEPDVLLVSPLSEVNTWGEYDLYCSDQAFLCRTKDLQNPEVYSYRTIDPDYPSYGGLSFEHLVGNYMKATGKKRKILNRFWIYHA